MDAPWERRLLVSPKLYDDFTLARSIVEVDKDNLLPGSQQKPSILEGHRE